MLSLWPELFDFAPIAPVILRVALGGTFLGYGLREIIKPHYLRGALARIVGLWDTTIGLLLIVGFFTQGVATLAILELFGYLLIRLADKKRLPIPIDYLLVMMAVAISLLFLGPGLWALDLPL